MSTSAYGKTGPHSHYIGYGSHMRASAGGTYVSTSPSGGRPSQMLFPFADPVAGLAGAISIGAHLRRARETNQSHFVDLSDLEATCLLFSDVFSNPDCGGAAPDGDPTTVRSSDGSFFALFVDSDGDRARCAEALGAGGPDDTSISLAVAGFEASDLSNALSAGETSVVPFQTPSLFGDTAKVLETVLGYSDGAVSNLAARQVIKVRRA